MPGGWTNDNTERQYLRKACYLKKKRGMDRKLKEDMPESMLLKKWPQLLDHQIKLPEPPNNVALDEMRKVCPGKPATLEEIEEISQETPFQTPFWKGNTTDTNIPERSLSPAEVNVINRKYLELKATFDAMRARQSTKDSVHRVEDVLVQLGMAHQKQVMDAVVQVQAGVETLTAKVDLGLQKKGGKKPEMIVAFLPCHDGDRFKNANDFYERCSKDVSVALR